MGRSYTVYEILVDGGEDRDACNVYHRCREFDSLAKTLRKKFPDHDFVDLPKKHMINNLKSDVVQARQVMLETFLEDLLSKSQVRESSEVIIFLTPSDNYNIPAAAKRVTKLKQPEHLRRQEVIKRKTLRRLKKEGTQGTSLADIWSKMGGYESLETLLPPKPRESVYSPFVQAELDTIS